MNQLYKRQTTQQSRCYNFENSTEKTGQGGMENQGAKGHAFDSIHKGESKTIFDVHNSGIIKHIWCTFKTADGVLEPLMLRGMRIEMYWDNSSTPAVSVPIGDFFGIGLGETRPYENEFFSCPGGKAFNSYIEMPFFSAAKIVIVNDTDKSVTHFFYTIEYVTDSALSREDILYFHAYWRREPKTNLGKDFEILPTVSGNGVFLGTNIGIIANPEYGTAWWGEGEHKVYIDEDTKFPTIIGTGSEDYIGTGWGLKEFSHRFQGCLVSNVDTEIPQSRCSFYRYHVPDPIYFEQSCKVTIQQIGGAAKSGIMEMTANNAELEPIYAVDIPTGGIKIRELSEPIEFKDLPIADTNCCYFYRRDDMTATAYLYLDTPNGVLPQASDLALRLDKIVLGQGKAGDD